MYKDPVRDDDCVRFLQWALPRLRLRWPGFRRVRGQVCKRVARRLADLGLDGLDGYRDHLGEDPREWRVLDRLCRVTISRFWRDRGTFATLDRAILPELASRAATAGGDRLAIWSCGCASGEEPYSLAILWAHRVQPRFPTLELRILATDLDLHLLRRGVRGVYTGGSVRELPAELATAGLEAQGRAFRVADHVREPVSFAQHDVRSGAPGGPFDLVLCRNLVFTYFDDDLQLEVGRRLVEMLRPGGALVIGGHEELPHGLAGLEPWPGAAHVFRRL